MRAFGEQEEHLLLNLANLGAVAIENARAYGDLQRLDDERVWFARTTHHQLRAPLAAVQGTIDALGFAGPLTATQQDLVSRARRRIQDAFDTIRDLLDLAAPQRVEASDDPSPCGWSRRSATCWTPCRSDAGRRGWRSPAICPVQRRAEADVGRTSSGSSGTCSTTP